MYSQHILKLGFCCTKYLWIVLDMLLKFLNVFKKGNISNLAPEVDF